MTEQREGNNNLGNKKIDDWYTCISVKKTWKNIQCLSFSGFRLIGILHLKKDIELESLPLTGPLAPFPIP